MIDNRPLYSVKLIPSEFKSSRTASLAWLIKVPENEIAELIAEGARYNRFSALTLKRDLGAEDAARLSENIWKLPGVIIAAEHNESMPTRSTGHTCSAIYGPFPRSNTNS